MKVVNEYVNVKIGDNTYIFNNLILDKYLRHMAESQEDFYSEYWQAPPLLTKCYVKFDSKLYFDETSMITTNEFDANLEMANNFLKTSENKVEIEYIYTPENNSIPFQKRRITAIGFFDSLEDYCYACVDLYDYSLSIQNGDNISIVRKDTISTNAIFNSSNSSIKAPIHLLPTMMKYKITNPQEIRGYPYYTNYITAHLYSVGLGHNAQNIKKETILDENNTEFFGEKIIFRNIFNVENIRGILEPGIRYPSSNLYPIDTKNDFTYLFMKYKVYYNVYTYPGSIDYKHVDTGEWYTLAVPIKAEGNFDYAITYERSDNNGI